MNIDFDFRNFQRETQERLAKIYAESLDEQEYLNEQECDETYHKIRKLLDCPEAEKCHPFLYSLKQDQVSGPEKIKVDKLYQLCLERGIIREDEDGDNPGMFYNDGEQCDGECCADNEQICGGPSDSLTGQRMEAQPIVKKPIFTVLYSGMKEGDLKMGEFYSMAPNTEGSKEDCIAQLTQQGYQSINIMAVEQTTPAVNTDIPDPEGEVDVSEVYSEDDSEEYLRQETGDTEGTTENSTPDDNEVISSDDVETAPSDNTTGDTASTAEPTADTTDDIATDSDVPTDGTEDDEEESDAEDDDKKKDKQD